MRFFSKLPIALFIFLFSCINEDFESSVQKVQLEPEYSLPLGTFLFPIDTAFLESGYIPDPNNNVLIEYSGHTYISSLSYIKTREGDFNINFSDKLKRNLISLTFHMVVLNYFPSDVDIQVYFKDSRGFILDSLAKEIPQKITRARVNANGDVTAPTSRIFEFTFTGNRLNTLLDAQKFTLYTKTYYSFENQQILKFTSHNRVEMITGVRFKIKSPANEVF